VGVFRDDGEIPLLSSLFYLFDKQRNEVKKFNFFSSFFRFKEKCCNIIFSNLSQRQCQVGSLAGAAHLLNCNAGVLR